MPGIASADDDGIGNQGVAQDGDDALEEEGGNGGGWWVASPLGGAAYTCKDRVEGNNGGWQVAGSPFTGKDRYEFEKFFAPRTVLTLSESVFRFIDTRQRISV